MPHQSTADYISSIDPLDIDFPSWWITNGAKLIQLESGVGTRIWLGNFMDLTQPVPGSCDWVIDADAEIDVHEFDWYFWLYGEYKAPISKDCRLSSNPSWLFYSIQEDQDPLPWITRNHIITQFQLTDFRNNEVCLYLTREITQKMWLGFFYLGIVTMLPNAKSIEKYTPTEILKLRTKIPPLWFYMGDTQSNFHAAHHNVPLGKGALCP